MSSIVIVVHYVWELGISGVRLDTYPDLPSVRTRNIAMSAESFSHYRGSARPLLGLKWRTLLSDSFRGITNFTIMRTKGVRVPEDYGKPAAKFDSSLIQIIWYKTLRACCATLHIQFSSDYVKFICNSDRCLYLTTKGKGKCFHQPPLSYHPASACVYTSVFHRSPVTSYAVLLRSPVRPWSKYFVQGYRWVKRGPTVNQATVVYPSLVDRVHWRLSKLCAHIHTRARTVCCKVIGHRGVTYCHVTSKKIDGVWIGNRIY
jgi:hypothetical protein